MSWRERSAWISLISTCAVFGVYFWYVADLMRHDTVIARPALVAFLVAGVVVVAVNAGLQAISALALGIERADERDAAIDARATRVAYTSLVGTLFFAFATIAFLGAIQTPSAEGKVLLPTFTTVTQFVLLMCVGCEILRSALLIVGYRRGA